MDVGNRKHDTALTLDWQEPTTLQDAIGHPGAGVFIVERAGEEQDSWLPAHIGSAAEGFGRRLRHMMEDVRGLGMEPDWDSVRVRLGVTPVRLNHPADRLALHALSRDVAARARAGEPKSMLPDEPGPTAREQKLLAQRGITDSGVLPPYLEV